jgi:hypothetical protein
MNGDFPQSLSNNTEATPRDLDTLGSSTLYKL